MKIGIIDSGDRPGSSLLRPVGLHDAARLPEGAGEVHDGQGDRRARVPAAGLEAAERSACLRPEDDRPRHARRRHRRREREDDHGTGRVVSGVAPRAYLGNYKVFVQTDAGLSPNANSPAIVAAIEAAVADGMDVINFSGGEPEIEPSRDIVARALDAAAAAGVVPVIAAGNEYMEVGAGSVSSPANSATRDRRCGRRDERNTPEERPCGLLVRGTDADLAASQAGRRRSRRRHPLVRARRRLVLVLRHEHGVAARRRRRGAARATPPDLDGGSRSSPRSSSPGPTHRTATVSRSSPGSRVAASSRSRVPTSPSSSRSRAASRSGSSRRGLASEESVSLRDAGGGAGTWSVTVEYMRRPQGASLALASSEVTVPGELALETRVGAAIRGPVRLPRAGARGADVRRIPFWGRVAAPRLPRHDAIALQHQGVYSGTTRGRPSLVSRYRYPENPSGVGVHDGAHGPGDGLPGADRASRRELRGRRDPASAGSPGRAQGRLGLRTRTASPASPAFPSRATRTSRTATTSRSSPPERSPPLPACTPSSSTAGPRKGAGRFRFRFWVNDVTPPTLRLGTPSVKVGRPVTIAAADAGSGVYSRSRVRVGRRAQRLCAVQSRRRSGGHQGPHGRQAQSAIAASPTTRRRRTPRTSHESSRTRGS